MHIPYRWLSPFVINWLLFASLAFFVVPAQAATYTVTNLNDSGPGSLRQAVLDAYENLSVSNIITFQTGLTGTITLTSGEIVVTGPLSIIGPGEGVLTINGNNQSRVFSVTIGRVTIQELKITGGSAGHGGAIYNTGILTLNHTTLSGNTATFSSCGGAIYNTGSLISTHLTVSNNLGWEGGGICNSGTVKLSNSAVVSNVVGTIGGGIKQWGTLGMTTISNSTLAYNKANDTGGGIFMGGGTMNVVNSTIYGNRAASPGGGIYVSDSTLTVSNSNITANYTTSGGTGGGIHFLYPGTVNLGNSIVVGNLATATTAPNLSVGDGSANYTSKGANLFGEDGVAGVAGITLMDTDLVLAGTMDTAVADLADNGGPTQTQALVVGSPAINAGDNSLIPVGITTDQRGIGFARIIETKVDIGAVEYGVGGTTYALTITKPGLGTGTVTSNPAAINCGSTCSFRFAANSSVTLTAVAATGSLFSSWSGACTGTAITCNVAMTAAKTATATFNLAASVPTVTTNAASNVTATSATLNAQVNSNGATATVSFDFGLTTAYGTSVAAASVYGNAAVTVNKPGLTCGQTYHYRIKAVNSKGTSYGENKTFTTVACTVTRRWPDFVITAVTLTPATPVANSNFSLSVTIKNQGLRGGDGGFLDVWANQAGVPGCGAVGTKYADVGFLNAGASKTFTIAGIPAGAKGTNKTARAFVDSWCEIVESNETNNQMIKMYSVQ